MKMEQGNLNTIKCGHDITASEGIMSGLDNVKCLSRSHNEVLLHKRGLGVSGGGVSIVRAANQAPTQTLSILYHKMCDQWTCMTYMRKRLRWHRMLCGMRMR